MANIKTTPEEWGRAREYFEAGLLLREVSQKTGIAIPNISKKAKNENWSKANEKQTLINEAVRLVEAKANLETMALTVHTELVDERTKHIQFFTTVAVRNVTESMNAPCENQNDFKARAETINKGREAVLGKAPDTAIQVNTTTVTGHGMEIDALALLDKMRC